MKMSSFFLKHLEIAESYHSKYDADGGLLLRFQV
jgi:hypothetical protein